jgi:hypothetical protein
VRRRDFIKVIASSRDTHILLAAPRPYPPDPVSRFAEKSRIIRRRHRGTFRNLLTIWKVAEGFRANII